MKIGRWVAPGILALAAFLVAPDVARSQPANDNCVNAIAVSCPSFADTQDTTTATNEPGEPVTTCGSSSPTTQSHSVWYRFTNSAGSFQRVTVSTQNSNYDTVLQVYDGACGAVTPHVGPGGGIGPSCNDDFDFGSGPTLQSEVSFIAPPGASNLIKVASFDSDAGGALQFSLVCAAVSIPTLSTWGQILLVSLLVVGGILALRRRRTTARPAI